MSDALLQALQARLGPGAVLTEPSDLEPYLVDHRRLYRGRARAIVRPGSVAEVSTVLALCNEQHVAVVPHGGNTSYCGGATPDESGTQIVLALNRLNRIRSVDPDNDSLVCEAGCVLADLQRAAADAGRSFPLSLGSEGSCQIGGNLSTNAGGTTVVRYGMTRDLVLGLEVVLADGRVLSQLAGLRKDNTGYDLRHLFIGAEGTLGVITAVALKLFPAIVSEATALVAVRDPAAAVALLGRVRAASGGLVSSFELIPRIGIELTVRHVPGVQDPFAQAYAWYVLCELATARPGEDLDALLAESLTDAATAGLVLDAVVARSGADRAAFWKLRESIPEAQRRDGASLKHDISVPVSALPEFMAQGAEWVGAHVPEGRLVAYGHVGDGNLHFNINQAPGSDARAFLAREPEIRRVLHDLVQTFGGSFSAEHGIGRLKVSELERYAQPVELDLMRAIKRALDPNGVLNPGKVLRAI